MQTQPKSTTLTLDPINNVSPSQSITIAGSLKNSDGLGIDGQTITFDGSGIGDSEPTAPTDNSGSFSVTITAPIVIVAIAISVIAISISKAKSYYFRNCSRPIHNS